VRTAHLPSALSSFITILRSQIVALKPIVPNALDA
jgi:hypothetical protein